MENSATPKSSLHCELFRFFNKQIYNPYVDPRAESGVVRERPRQFAFGVRLPLGPFTRTAVKRGFCVFNSVRHITHAYFEIIKW